MVKICSVCQSMYEESEGEFYKHVPKICSPECFAEILKDSSVSFVSTPPGNRRSMYEIEFECFLNRYQIPFRYEDHKIILKNGDWYLPDYYFGNDTYAEVKGLWQKGSRKKIRMFPKDKKIYVVEREVLNRLKISSREKQEALKKSYVLH